MAKAPPPPKPVIRVPPKPHRPPPMRLQYDDEYEGKSPSILEYVEKRVGWPLTVLLILLFLWTASMGAVIGMIADHLLTRHGV